MLASNTLKIFHKCHLFITRVSTLSCSTQGAVKTLSELIDAGDVKAVNLHLSSKRGDVNAADDCGLTPLMHAVKQGHADVTEALVSQCRDLDVRWRNHLGINALELAMFYQHKDIYSMLLETGSFKTSLTSNDVLCHKLHTSLRREAAHHQSPDWLAKTVSLPSTMFIVLRKGWPLTVTRTNVLGSGKTSKSTNLFRLSYSAISEFINGENLIYLGIHDSSSSTEREPVSSVQEVSTNMAKLACNIDNDSQSQNVESVAYFCIDLSDLDEDVVNRLCHKHSNGEAELIHPFRVLKLTPGDRTLYNQAWPLIDWNRRNKYCPTCGSVTKLVDGGFKRLCLNLSCLTRKGIQNVSYPRVDPSVICAIGSSDGRLCLLARKSTFPYEMYSCVAGFVEPGESLENACAREVKEEVGVDVTRLRYHSSQFWPNPSVLMAGYVAEADPSQPLKVDTSELESAQWFDRAAVVSMLIHEHPGQLFVPPAEAIAHQLIKAWLLDTAFL